MKTLSVSYTRQNLASVMQHVNHEGQVVLITSERGKPVVMMSLEKFNSLVNDTPAPEMLSAVDETLFLTRSEANARRLAESAKRLGLLRGESSGTLEHVGA